MVEVVYIVTKNLVDPHEGSTDVVHVSLDLAKALAWMDKHPLDHWVYTYDVMAVAPDRHFTDADSQVLFTVTHAGGINVLKSVSGLERSALNMVAYEWSEENGHWLSIERWSA